MQTAYLAIQCRASTGQVGTFLYTGDKPASNPPVSPVTDTVATFLWARANGWTQTAYDPAHPCGVYVQTGAA